MPQGDNHLKLSSSLSLTLSLLITFPDIKYTLSNDALSFTSLSLSAENEIRIITSRYESVVYEHLVIVQYPLNLKMSKLLETMIHNLPNGLVAIKMGKKLAQIRQKLLRSA